MSVSHDRLTLLITNIIKTVQTMIPDKLSVLNNEYFEFHISSMEVNGPIIQFSFSKGEGDAEIIFSKDQDEGYPIIHNSTESIWTNKDDEIKNKILILLKDPKAENFTFVHIVSREYKNIYKETLTLNLIQILTKAISQKEIS